MADHDLTGRLSASALNSAADHEELTIPEAWRHVRPLALADAVADAEGRAAERARTAASYLARARVEAEEARQRATGAVPEDAITATRQGREDVDRVAGRIIAAVRPILDPDRDREWASFEWARDAAATILTAPDLAPVLARAVARVAPPAPRPAPSVHVPPRAPMPPRTTARDDLWDTPR